MTHYSPEQWIDFVNGAAQASAQQEMQAHLASGSERCKERVATWRRVQRSAALEAKFQPPVDTVRMAKAAFAGLRLHFKALREWRWFPLRWARRGRPSTQTRRVPRRSLPLSMASAFPHMLGSEEIAMTQTLKIEGSEAAAAAESNVLPERITIPVTGMTCSA